MTIDEALLWTERLVAIALLQQSIELLLLRRTWSDDGIWSWAVLQEEFPRFFSLFMGASGFTALVILQVVAASLLVAVSSLALLLFLFTSAALISMRFRGTFNGGSDSMTLIILSVLVVARARPELAPAAMLYLAIQAGLSYFIAGLVKIKEPRWRSGAMLKDFMLLTNYPVASGARSFFASAGARTLAGLSWAVMTWECLFPLAYSGSRAAGLLLAGGFLFHLVNVYVLGLNRFLTAWCASYPAVLAASTYLQSRF